MPEDSEMLAETEALIPAPAPRDREAVVRATLDEVRPALQRDGGDCELIEINGSRVFVRMTGACVFCKLAGATLESIQSRLMETLGEFIVVVPVAGAVRPRH